jgi:hypothetical protein
MTIAVVVIAPQLSPQFFVMWISPLGGVSVVFMLIDCCCFSCQI